MQFFKNIFHNKMRNVYIRADLNNSNNACGMNIDMDNYPTYVWNRGIRIQLTITNNNPFEAPDRPALFYG